MNEVMNTQQLPSVPSSVNVPLNNVNQGTIAVEAARASAEVQGKIWAAKAFPRDEVAAFKKVFETCQRREFAEKAFYSYSRGGGIVSGVTIRFAEELARIWEHVDYGIKELSQEVGKSEMQAFAWDKQTNTMRIQNFTNPHIREVKGVAKALTSIRDIYEANSNSGARRVRSCILAILPNELVEMAIAECRKTLAGNNDVPLIDRVKNMVVAFAKLGVTQEQIETRLKRKIDTMTVDDLTDYIGIYNAIKHGESKAAEWFEAEKEASDLTAALKGGEPNA